MTILKFEKGVLSQNSPLKFNFYFVNHLSCFQAAKERQSIRNEEIEIEVIERRKLIEVEDKEIERRENELKATVKLPAEAESYKVQTLAEAAKYVEIWTLLVFSLYVKSRRTVSDVQL